MEFILHSLKSELIILLRKSLGYSLLFTIVLYFLHQVGFDMAVFSLKYHVYPFEFITYKDVILAGMGVGVVTTLTRN